MRTYIIRRLLLMIPTVFLVSLIVFFGMRLLPGNVVDEILVSLSYFEEADRAALEHALGLDVPAHIQYVRWLGVAPQADGSFSGIFQGNLGTSLISGRPVIDHILPKWPVTLELGLMALIIAQLIALPIGIYSALRQDTWGDYIARSFAILSISIPTFWLGTIVIVFPAVWWRYMPPILYIPFTEDPIGNLRMFIPPAIVLGMLLSGVTMRLTRTMMLEVLRQDYIRTAWAKGLRERAVVMRHALKNALIPVVTIVGTHMPIMIGGAVITETIFSLPGMGFMIVGAALKRDYSVLSGVLLFFAVGLVLINLMVDLTYGFLDPRIHYE